MKPGYSRLTFPKTILIHHEVLVWSTMQRLRISGNRTTLWKNTLAQVLFSREVESALHKEMDKITQVLLGRKWGGTHHRQGARNTGGGRPCRVRGSRRCRASNASPDPRWKAASDGPAALGTEGDLSSVTPREVDRRAASRRLWSLNLRPLHHPRPENQRR
jgi:hypothetical protein